MIENLVSVFTYVLYFSLTAVIFCSGVFYCIKWMNGSIEQVFRNGSKRRVQVLAYITLAAVIFSFVVGMAFLIISFLLLTKSLIGYL